MQAESSTSGNFEQSNNKSSFVCGTWYLSAWMTSPQDTAFAASLIGE
jgi:hypothetical protein